MTAQGEARGELRECPFCGGPPMLHSYHEAEGMAGVNRIYWVTCDRTRPNHCQAGGGVPVSNRQSEAEAIAAWNRRPVPQAEAVEAARRIIDWVDLSGEGPTDAWPTTVGDSISIARALLFLVEGK